MFLLTAFWHTLFGASINFSLTQISELLNIAKSKGLKPLPVGSELSKIQANTLSTDIKMTKEQIELGKTLYFDPRLSGNKLLSCNSCHNLSLGATSEVRKENNKALLNAPTLYNVVFNNVMHYNGDITSTRDLDSSKKSSNLSALTKAILASFSKANELNNTAKGVVENINDIKNYKYLFKRAYGSDIKVTPELVANTIASFVATLTTPSRFDDFLHGNLKALSQDELEGLVLFIKQGCISCHAGVNLGGTMQPFGVLKPYKFASLGGFKGDSNGNIKVPTLRNITMTMPYFHNGGYKELHKAIDEMGKIQMGVNLSSRETKLIASFLSSLDGYIAPVKIPLLPSSYHDIDEKSVIDDLK
ncbi:hypothetical protein BKH40_03305 [Helicobacter sp. 11S02629-2]|nr:hypothetical protein BKH40_03305 [Helicobacter sp. 11S02629-2]